MRGILERSARAPVRRVIPPRYRLRPETMSAALVALTRLMVLIVLTVLTMLTMLTAVIVLTVLTVLMMLTMPERAPPEEAEEEAAAEEGRQPGGPRPLIPGKEVPRALTPGSPKAARSFTWSEPATLCPPFRRGTGCQSATSGSPTGCATPTASCLASL